MPDALRIDETLTVSVSIDNAGWSEDVPDAETICARFARAALVAGLAADPAEALPAAPWEIGFALAGDADIQPLNLQWRRKDAPTNVLSFPTHSGSSRRQMPTEMSEPLGDVMLAYGTCAREAEAAGITLADHLAHLVTHGVLHILGFDHDTDSAARDMEAIESRVLVASGIADPYAMTEVA